MDPLAHTLVGAALSRTRLARDTPRATATLVAAANLPDVDALAYFGGEDAALAFRRGVTHGPLGFALLPLALVGAVALLAGRHGGAQRVPFGRLTALAYLGALTHPLLDYLNVYGVRLLAPFSDRWFYGDALFIVDPWFWLLLGVTAFLVRPPTRPAAALWLAVAAATTAIMVSRAPTWASWTWLAAVALATATRLAARPALLRHRERIAAAGIAGWLLYLGGMTLAAASARRDVAAELASRGVGPVVRSMVAPVAVDPRPRDVVVALPDAFRFGRYSLASGELTLEPAAEPKPPDTPAVRAALADPSVRGFVGWARFLFVRVETDGERTRVDLVDGRYAREAPARGRGFGAATVVVEAPAASTESLRAPAARDR